MGSPATNEPSVTASRAYSPEVMVSYSSHDRALVMQFTERLRAAGVAAWIDQGGIDGAQKWGEEIVNAIDSCKIVILMISQTSMQSENIAREVMLAWENNKHFLPLCLEDTKVAKSMQYQLAGIQQIKLYEGDPEVKFLAVLRALVRLGVHVSPYSMALISADLGEREQAFEGLERAINQRSSNLAHLKTEPRFGVLRGDPRFAALLKRVEALPLEEETLIPDAPVVLPYPVMVTPPTAKPAPLWKKIVWPDIYDGARARAAAAQGVWISGFSAIIAILTVIFTPAPGTPSIWTPGMGVATGFVVLVILGGLAFGIQKMSRPVAVIALVLCAFGTMSNLTRLQNAGVMLDGASAQYRLYPQNPNVVQGYDLATSNYYGSWFALLVSLICAVGYTNATRGTFAYHRMVMARATPDKQDALAPGDVAAIKSKIAGLFKKSRAAASSPAVVTPPNEPFPGATQMVRPAAAATESVMAAEMIAAPVVSAPVVSAPVVAAPVVVPPTVVAPVVVAPVAVAPVVVAPIAEVVRQSFAAMIGVSGGLIFWPRVLAFLGANVAASLIFMLSRSLTSSSISVTPIYWLWTICAAVVFTAATVAGFRLVSNAWAAMAAAAGMTALVTLPLYSLLPTFAWSDIGYREQFQQFILLPLISSFILLAVLSWIVPRLQPMVLALWLAAMGAEIATSIVTNLLHALGAGDPTDAVLGGASVISAVLRSLAFALALWGGLELLRKQAAKGTAS